MKTTLVHGDLYLPKGEGADCDYLVENSKDRPWSRYNCRVTPYKNEQIEDFEPGDVLIADTDRLKALRFSWDRSARVWRMIEMRTDWAVLEDIAKESK